jgi:hypothetical protein
MDIHRSPSRVFQCHRDPSKVDLLPLTIQTTPLFPLHFLFLLSPLLLLVSLRWVLRMLWRWIFLQKVVALISF